MVKIKTNIVYEHLLESNKKIVIEQGGTRSGKTFNILLWIIFQYCTNNNGKIVTICRKTFPSLRATVLRDFISILQQHKVYSEKFHNKSNSEYHLFDNLIEFISLAVAAILPQSQQGAVAARLMIVHRLLRPKQSCRNRSKTRSQQDCCDHR